MNNVKNNLVLTGQQRLVEQIRDLKNKITIEECYIDSGDNRLSTRANLVVLYDRLEELQKQLEELNQFE